ncbi:MAG: type III toxin-antitoxin system ToxN/AbiQ family toxin [Eubacterium sp.]|nr:type III toxin-antitoxin system ToxN/AbiQ family toxin [Eubacterium sp.]
MQTEFKLYKVDMNYIRNLHHVDDKVLSVSPQTGKDRRIFIGIVIVCSTHKYCIPLSSPKAKHKNMKNSMDFSKIEVVCTNYNKKKIEVQDEPLSSLP